MSHQKYYGEFKNRLDVARQFEEGRGDKYGDGEYAAVEGFPSDDEILYADYEQECYEGSAFVLFERDGKLYEVNGSHCSCMGLEGQWTPEETSWEALAIREPSRYGAPEVVVTLAKSKVAKADRSPEAP